MGMGSQSTKALNLQITLILGKSTKDYYTEKSLESADYSDASHNAKMNRNIERLTSHFFGPSH